MKNNLALLYEEVELMNFPYDMAIWAIVAIVAIIYGNKNSKK